MSLESLIIHYGYPALFAGSILEGDAVVVIAAALATRGDLSLVWVIAVAGVATFVADQTLFHLGRTKGPAFLDRRPAWRPRVRRARAIVERYHAPVIVGFRFFYGLRTVTPFVIGMSGYSPVRFAMLDAVGSLIWATVMASAGYAIGEALSALLGQSGRYQMWAIAAIALVVGAVWFVRVRGNRAPPAGKPTGN